MPAGGLVTAGAVAGAVALGKLGYDAYQNYENTKQMNGSTSIDPRDDDAIADQYQTQYQGLAAAAQNKANSISMHSARGEDPYQIEQNAYMQQTAAQGNVASGLSNYQNLYNSIGTGPSLAQAQLQQGLNSSIAAQQSQAASATGGGYNQASATRAAMMNGANLAMNANAQASTLRAQEVLNNQQAKASALAGYSNLVSTQAQQGQNMANEGEGMVEYDRSQGQNEYIGDSQLAQSNVNNAYNTQQNMVNFQNSTIQQNNAVLAAKANHALAVTAQNQSAMTQDAGGIAGAASGIAQAYSSSNNSSDDSSAGDDDMAWSGAEEG